VVGTASSGCGVAIAVSGASPRRVYQDRFGYGEGNCAWACVATLFGVGLDRLRLPPPSDSELMAWSKGAAPMLEFHNRDLATNYRIEEGYEDVEGVGTGRWAYDVPDEWEPPVPGFWLASVNSPGLKRPVEDPYYPMPALHMVVMCGRDMYHDPNPRYADLVPYEPTVVGQTWWTGGASK
jgi:hypothetical protein